MHVLRPEQRLDTGLLSKLQGGNRREKHAKNQKKNSPQKIKGSHTCAHMRLAPHILRPCQARSVLALALLVCHAAHCEWCPCLAGSSGGAVLAAGMLLQPRHAVLLAAGEEGDFNAGHASIDQCAQRMKSPLSVNAQLLLMFSLQTLQRSCKNTMTVGSPQKHPPSPPPTPII